MRIRVHGAGRTGILITTSMIVAAALTGCAAPVRVRTTAYDVELAVDPVASRIAASTTLHCTVVEPRRQRQRNLTLDIDLHPDLDITRTCATGAIVREVCAVAKMADLEHGEKDNDQNDATPPTTHRIYLDKAHPEFDLTIAYEGRLWQDVEAGEKRGEIHNFTVSAHLGTNGIYLAGGNWYPTLHHDSDAAEPPPLARYNVAIQPVEGYTFVASGSPRPTEDGGPTRFASDFPQTELVVVGGRYRLWQRDADGTRLAILLHPDRADEETLARRANLFLSAAADYLARYEHLVGPYPFGEFTIVENFFSSGFAFPTFTLLGPEVIAMEDRALRHGYLDHELLHSWWGNSVYVDPTDGNWCEALTSFAANLHGYMLDGDMAGARKARRDVCNAISRIAADDDKPLDTFSQPGGAGRTIGYAKGSLVFHMLARQIRFRAFWQAMQTFDAEYRGKYANWGDLQRAFELASGADLQPFFDEWVHDGGSPRFSLNRADEDETESRLDVGVRQEGGPFSVDLPLRLHLADGTTRDILPRIDQEMIRIPLDDVVGVRNADAPVEIELDPEYQVVRKLAGAEVLPTIAGCLRGERAIVVSANTSGLWDGYRTFVRDVRKKRKADTTTLATEATADGLNASTVVIIGDAVRQPAVRDLLDRAACPVAWTDTGFRIDDRSFDDPGFAVLCCLRHPDLPEATITVYYGNSVEALANADILWFYGNSLLVFEASPGGHGFADVALRRDFEHTLRMTVTPTAPPAAPPPAD